MSKHLVDPTINIVTLVDLLQWRAVHQPEQRAYIFLQDGETEEVTLTYRELDQQARAIGAQLQYAGAQGKRVLLLYPSSLDYIAALFGCFYAGAVAVPTYLPRRDRPDLRLRALVQDTQASMALTNQTILSKIKQHATHISELDALQWLTTDYIAIERAEQWQAAVLGSETLAFIQYSSGSMGTPKGVMITHGNLLYTERMIAEACGHSNKTLLLGWLPLFHDMGLVGNILQPIYLGIPSWLMSPGSFLQKPIRWLQAISRYRVTSSAGPNFAYDLCVEKITAEQRADLDLSSWDVACNGAEPIRAETLARFVAAFGPCGFRPEAFYPCYGMSEATLFVSGSLKTAPPIICSVQGAALDQNRVVTATTSGVGTRDIVSSGRAWLEQQIIIVDPESCIQCAPDRVGEIWVAGPNIAPGYWNRTDETEYAFRAYLADTGEGPFLRTGDLGFIRDGELFVTGRHKDLIIIRGRNHYPQDIEFTMEKSHAALQPTGGAAFAVDVAGEERLVLVQEVRRHSLQGFDVDAVVQGIRQAVAEEHDVQVYAVVLIKPGSLPKTSSGKVQRHKCRINFLESSLQAVGTWTQNPAENEATSVSDEVSLASSEPAPSEEAIQSWLVSQLARRLRVIPQDINLHESFAHYGLDSKEAVGLSGELEAWLGRQLSPTLAYEYPTIASLAQHLTHNTTTSVFVAANQSDQTPAAGPIAIIGIGCRFPGAEDPQAFWSLLRDGVDAISEVPGERWDARAYYDPNPQAPGKMSTRWGGFVAQVSEFDPYFFGISPREAARIDPQQRLLLEVAWEALEDAGQAPNRLAGTQTGVFIGISSSDYSQLQLRDPNLSGAYVGTGSALSIAANRLSYFLNLRGPSMAVDTACSSSLVAVHLACQSLLHGEATLALAGGVNLILSPVLTVNFTKAGFMAPDGRCKTFDARADGYVRGEGAGIVVLKQLSDALVDGDPVYAVIRGSAINQDGRTNGLMAPNRQAQEAVLCAAYQRSGVPPGEVQYVEAHGTGTLLGDLIEAQALGAVLSTGRPPSHACAVGSVKTNIGHLEAAAGIAGLIKVALSLKERMIPPSLNFQEPNPHIPFDVLSLHVQQMLTPYARGDNPARAGVSSFGFGGTNAHVVLEEASQPLWPPPADKSLRERAQLLPLSAHNPEALRSLARAYQQFLTEETTASQAALPDICYTATMRRSHHTHRMAVVAQSQEELAEHLTAFLHGERRPGVATGRQVSGLRRKLVFVFPGQGAQWFGMGRQLLEQETVFRSTLEQCDQIMQHDVDWSLLAELTADEAHSRLHEIDVIQPILFAIQVALANLWRSWDIEPDAVVGHSMGEVAAAHVAGALSLEDAVCIICRRSRLLKRVSGQGAMAVVELSLDAARWTVAGYANQVSVAINNSPSSTVLSGDPTALAEVLETLQQQDVFCRWVKVDVASHSPQMDVLRAELLHALQEVRPQSATVPIYSTVTGAAIDGQKLDAAYWVRNLRDPVLFSTVIQQLCGDEHDLFLEISPHPILLPAVQQGLHDLEQEGTMLPSMRREADEWRTVLESLGMLYACGHPVAWRRLYPAGGQCVRLPSYPWQRERCWLDMLEAGAVSGENIWWNPTATATHPLLGHYVPLAHPAGSHVWETHLDQWRLPYLADHHIQGAAVLPVAVYVEMALAAVKETTGLAPPMLTDLELHNAFVMHERDRRIVQSVLSCDAGDTMAFHVYSRSANGKDSSMLWTLHATAQIRSELRSDGWLMDGHGISPQQGLEK